MVNISMTYSGQLHCELTHGPSGSKIVTDAPKDNQGKGEAFSPTDLVAAALGSCMLTVMGIASRTHGIKMEGAKAEVEKQMIATPIRRIGKISVVLTMPAGIAKDKRELLEKAALHCPVHKSLHPDVQIPLQIIYPD